MNIVKGVEKGTPGGQPWEAVASFRQMEPRWWWRWWQWRCCYEHRLVCNWIVTTWKEEWGEDVLYLCTRCRAPDHTTGGHVDSMCGRDCWLWGTGWHNLPVWESYCPKSRSLFFLCFSSKRVPWDSPPAGSSQVMGSAKANQGPTKPFPVAAETEVRRLQPFHLSFSSVLLVLYFPGQPMTALQ